MSPSDRRDLKLGAPYHFTPAAFSGEKSAVLPGGKPVPRAVTGKIVFIHWAHRYFVVEYELNGCKLEEAIKF